MTDAAEQAERSARESYGRLIAFLAARSGDLAAAEDALADAFAAALQAWPKSGVPDRPEAWLMATAKRRQIDATRRRMTRSAAEPGLLFAAKEAQTMSDQVRFPDERLKLMLVCAHPAIDPAARTPLMLQTVLGVEASRIASAFLISPDAMAKRLVRAKSRIKETGLRFEEPDADAMPERLNDVLEAIYAAYGLAWDDLADTDTAMSDLSSEAVWLARLITQLLPSEPEAHGLLALILYCEARRGARRTPEGRYVPLADQDTRLWSRALHQEAETALRVAAKSARLGRFQIEAAIQSAHGERALTGVIPWAQIIGLYRLLCLRYPTRGAEVALAAALVGAGRPSEALAHLDTLPGQPTYQPYWAVRARALLDCGREAEAGPAFDLAIGLSTDESVRRFLLSQRQRSSV